jgi:hypothetical protein
MTMNANVTPADVAGVMKPPTSIKIADVPAATPTTPTQPADYQQYKGIYDIYAPVQQMQQTQVGAVNDRYATNSADIKNLFGTLTTLREADKIKLQQQTADVLMQQQSDLASRTAEARMNSQSSAQSAQQASSELGGGPAANTVNALANQATTRGIAQSNNLGTIWQGMQGAQSLNNLQAIQGQQAAYGGKQADMMKQLDLKHSGELLQLQQQQTQIDQQIAQAKNDYNVAVANRNASAAQAALARNATLQAARIRAGATLGAAKIAADSRTQQPKTYTNDASGWSSKANDAGKDPNALSSSLDAAFAKVGGSSTSTMPGSTFPDPTAKKPTKQAILAQWKKDHTDNKGAALYDATDLALVTDYLKYIY